MIYPLRRRYGKKSKSRLKSMFEGFIMAVNLSIVILLTVLLVFYQGGILPSTDAKYNYDLDENGFEQSHYDFPNLRYASKDINYTINKCNEKEINNIHLTLSTFENNTVLRFHEYNLSDPINLFYTCQYHTPAILDIYDTTLAQGGPNSFEPHLQYLEILTGEVDIYYTDNCNTTGVITHETLHAFGFTHNKNPNSILYPYYNCNQKVNQYFYDRINKLYEGVG